MTWVTGSKMCSGCGLLAARGVQVVKDSVKDFVWVDQKLAGSSKSDMYETNRFKGVVKYACAVKKKQGYVKLKYRHMHTYY